MPKLTCKCENIIHYGQIPCPEEWAIFSDMELDKFSGMVDIEELYLAAKNMLKCPQCGRLYVFWNGYRENPQVFRPD